ncbi:MAG: DNA polymerase III subunit delta, partial [Xanthomonadales bacterium]|nr:DNA polymerase III subunit delta [Xanthomonadales bacterium]
LLDLRLPSGRPGKEGSAAIITWCQSPPPDTALLISAQEWSKAHQGAWVSAVEKVGCFVPLWPLKMDELPVWVAARAHAQGIDADADAVTMLVERTEGNLLAAAQEIDKLAMIHGKGKLDAATLNDLVADSARFDVFKLTDAAFTGDSARALHIVAGLRSEGEDVLRMLGWLQRQIELALRLATARDFAAQARVEHLWPARTQLFRKALRRSDAAHWQRCLLRAGRIDQIVKGRADGNAEREFERLIVMISDPRAARALV